jgi:hypothetical protein
MKISIKNLLEGVRNATDAVAVIDTVPARELALHRRIGDTRNQLFGTTPLLVVSTV